MLIIWTFIKNTIFTEIIEILMEIENAIAL